MTSSTSRFATAALAGLCLFSCGSLKPFTDVRVQRTTRSNPIVLVPGIMGCDLEFRESKQLVFGEFGNLKAASQALQLPPYTNEGAFQSALDEVEPSVMWDAPFSLEVKTPDKMEDFGISLGASAGGSERIYSEFRHALVESGFQFDPETLDKTEAPLAFSFAYDWRQPNAVSGQLLSQFLHQKREHLREAYKQRAQNLLQEGDAEGSRELTAWAENFKFDLVCHSMGGLVAYECMKAPLPDQSSQGNHNWPGADMIASVTFAGTPFEGSPAALGQLANGYRTKAAFIPLYEAARPIIGSFPSVYELLPQGSLAHQAQEALGGQISEVETWTRNELGLATGVEPYGKSLLNEMLSGALGDRRAMRDDNWAEQPINFHLVVSKSKSSPGSIAINTTQDRPLKVALDSLGDGTVPVASAMPAWISSNDNCRVYFVDADHMTLLAEDDALEVIGQILRTSESDES